jgi:hypothetical protein
VVVMKKSILMSSWSWSHSAVVDGGFWISWSGCWSWNHDDVVRWGGGEEEIDRRMKLLSKDT